MIPLKNEFPEYFHYHGRKISKKISKANLNILNKFYYKYFIDEELIYFHKKKIETKKHLIFKNYSCKINLEIGFGDGEFLIKNAVSNPEEIFIGVEVYLNGIVKVLKEILNSNIQNIKLCNLNSIYLLKTLPKKSIDRIYIINPDPWAKRRHNKRRLITPENLKLFNKVTKSKGSVSITTDSESYVKAIRELSIYNQELIGEINIRLLNKNDVLYGISRYQRKAIKKGDKIYLITI